MGMAGSTFPHISPKTNIKVFWVTIVFPGKLLARKRHIETITRFSALLVIGPCLLIEEGAGYQKSKRW